MQLPFRIIEEQLEHILRRLKQTYGISSSDMTLSEHRELAQFSLHDCSVLRRADNYSYRYRSKYIDVYVPLVLTSSETVSVSESGPIKIFLKQTSRHYRLEINELVRETSS
jgi:hypothetical protein